MTDVARLGLAVGGAILGNIVAPGIGASLGFAAGATAGTLIFGGGPGSVREGPRLNDLKVMASAPGRPRPLLYGTMRLGGNVIWATDIEEHKLEEEQGGKGGPTVTTVNYVYLANFAVALCEGPVQGLLKIFADGKLIADYTAAGGPVLDESMTSSGVGGQAAQVRFHLGTASQAPDPLIQAREGIANAPAYRGTCYIVFENFPLADYGNRIPQVTCVVTTNAGANLPTVNASAPYAGIDEIVWQPGRQFFVTFAMGDNYYLTRYHAPTQQLVAQATHPVYYLGDAGSARPNVAGDALGRIYAIENMLAGTTVTQFDGETFAMLATTQIGDSFGFPVGEVSFKSDFVKTCGLTSQAQYVVVIGSGAFSAADKFAIVGTTPILGLLPVVQETDLSSLLAGQLGSPHPSIVITDATADGDGYCWLGCALSGTDGTLLVKVHPALGTILGFWVVPSPPNVHGPLLTYDAVTESLLLLFPGGDGAILRWSLATEQVEATRTGLLLENFGGPSNGNLPSMLSGPWNGTLWLESYNPTQGLAHKLEIDTTTLATVRTLDPTSWVSGGIQGAVYDRSTHALIGNASGGIRWLFLDRVSGGGVSLASIVADVSERIGIAAGVRDTTELTDSVHGYVVSSRMTARAAVEPLTSAYFFDAVESDFKVKFPKRGGAAVLALTEDDLGADPSPNGSRPYLIETRREEVELPARVEVTAALATADYQPHSEYAKRSEEAVQSARQDAIELPVAFDSPDSIARIADTHLWREWAERTRYSFATPLRHARLDPTDVATVTVDGTAHTLRIEESTLGANSVVAFEGVSDLAAVYVSSVSGRAPLGVPAQAITPLSPLTFHLLDTPLLRDDDDGAILYMVAGSYGSGAFPGVGVDKSADGSAWSGAAVIGSERNAVIGYATNALTDAPGGRWTTWDRVNSVTVRLYRGTLASASELDVLNYANAILIGDEVVQFAAATLNADGTYTLSTLLRGRRGTEWACATHVANERVVLLQLSTVLAVTTPLTERALSRIYRATPIGGSLSASVQRALAWTAASLRPYAPCNVAGSRGGSPQDWTFTWNWRTRVGGEWLDFSDAHFSENSHSYEIDVSIPGSPNLFTMTATPFSGGSWVDSVNQRALLTESDQRAVWGTPQSSVTLTVYQLSAQVGRGFGRSATLDG